MYITQKLGTNGCGYIYTYCMAYGVVKGECKALSYFGFL